MFRSILHCGQRQATTFLCAALLQLPLSSSSFSEDLDRGYSLPPLPEASTGQPPLAVSGLDAQNFRALIPDALYPVVRSGELALGVYASAPWEPAPQVQSWQTAPEKSCLGSDGRSLQAEMRWSNEQFPCGTALTLSKLSAQEQETAGRRWLLNVDRALAGSAALTRRELSLKATNTSLQNGSIRIDTLVPSLLPQQLAEASSSSKSANAAKPNPVISPPEGSPLLWRERQSWLDPQPLRKAGALTLRFRGMAEDIFHVASPISGRFREVTGSNRSDELFGLPLSAEDISVWGEKVEWIESARFVGVRTLLVPVLGVERLKARAAEPGCVEVTQRAPDGDALVSVWSKNLLFAPREVVEIEAVSADPFTTVGKRRLFVDTQSMLPVMKIVYDRTGQQMRVVLGSLMGLADSESKQPEALSLMGPVLTVGSGARLAVLYPETVMTCKNFSASLPATLFDLREIALIGLDPKAAKSAAAALANAADGSAASSSADSAEEIVDER